MMINSKQGEKQGSFNKLQLDRLTDTIKNSWQFLLPFYHSITLSLDNKEKYIINEKDMVSFKNNVQQLDNVEQEYILELYFNGDLLGKLICLSYESELNFDKFNEFVKQSAEFRNQLNYTKLIPDGLIITSLDQKDKWVNPIAKEILNRLNLENEGIIYDFSKIMNQPALRSPSPECVSVIQIWNMKIEQYKLTEIMIPIIIKNKVRGAFIIVCDNTIIQSEEEELLNKSAVIKEIHHRVKNNMQMIASLLRLQMRRVSSKAVEKAFKESINRISSMALIYEELSKEGLDEINLKDTVSGIMDMIFGNMVSPTKNIKGVIEGIDVFINANKATSIALCVTELIQNAIEHAFKFRRKGIIVVRIQQEQETENAILVSVQDDGIGYNSIKTPSSLGLEIIEMITKETLKGNFKIEGHTYGTKCTITFPNK